MRFLNKLSPQKRQEGTPDAVVKCHLLMLVTAEFGFHVRSLSSLVLSFSTLPAPIALGTNRFALFQVTVAWTTLMVESALVARLFDAAIVFSLPSELAFGVLEQLFG